MGSEHGDLKYTAFSSRSGHDSVIDGDSLSPSLPFLFWKLRLTLSSPFKFSLQVAACTEFSPVRVSLPIFK